MKLIPLMTVAVAVALFPNVAGAQITNFVPLTRLEAFEMVTGRVIIKGTEEIGSVAGKNGLVTVKCEELRDVASNQREFGLVIQVQQNENLQETTTVDADELESLLRGVDYIARADPSISSLNHFEAAYTTRGAFRVVSYSSRRTSNVEAAVTIQRLVKSKSLLTLAQLAQFKELLDQAQTKLELIRKNK